MSVPSLEVGPPTPPLKASVSPLGPKGGEQHSLAVEGVGGSQFGRLDRKPVYSVGYSMLGSLTMYVLCTLQKVSQHKILESTKTTCPSHLFDSL